MKLLKKIFGPNSKYEIREGTQVLLTYEVDVPGQGEVEVTESYPPKIRVVNGTGGIDWVQSGHSQADNVIEQLYKKGGWISVPLDDEGSHKAHVRTSKVKRVETVCTIVQYRVKVYRDTSVEDLVILEE